MSAYIEYLINKLVIFDKDADVDVCNSIIEAAKIIEKLQIPKICNENSIISLTQEILSEFKCYEVIDTEFENRIDSSKAQDLHAQFKSDSLKPVGVKMDVSDDVDTSDTFYVDTVDRVTTKKLVMKFGKLRHTGEDGDKFRYEYPFVLGENKFVLYDYMCENGEFEKEAKISWHIASNTEDKEALSGFKKQLGSTLGVNL